jgi:hypothetical protein
MTGAWVTGVSAGGLLMVRAHDPANAGDEVWSDQVQTDQWTDEKLLPEAVCSNPLKREAA